MGDSAVTAASASAAAEPFWGHSDSNVRWCEIDYAVTPYVAEFWNTLSSMVIIVVGTIGWFLCKRHGIRLPRVYAAFALIAITGFGSTMFHMTNRYWAQCLDELPMLYGNMVFVNIIMEARLPRRFHLSPAVRHSVADVVSAVQYPWLPYVLASFALTITIIYFALPQFYMIFLLSYGGVVAFLTIYSIKQCYCDKLENLPSFAPSSSSAAVAAVGAGASAASASSASSASSGKDVMALPRKLFWSSLFFYGFGTSMWITENTLCPPAVHIAANTPPDTVAALNRIQLHAWWHLAAALGTYLWVQYQMSLLAVSRLGSFGPSMAPVLRWISTSTSNRDAKPVVAATAVSSSTSPSCTPSGPATADACCVLILPHVQVSLDKSHPQ